MPGFDGMGPLGAGSMTGRGCGFCISYVDRGAGFAPGYAPALVRGGRGRRGRRNWFHAAGLPWRASADIAPAHPFYHEENLNVLKEQAGYLEEALARVKSRISDLEAKTDKE